MLPHRKPGILQCGEESQGEKRFCLRTDSSRKTLRGKDSRQPRVGVDASGTRVGVDVSGIVVKWLSHGCLLTVQALGIPLLKM